MWQIHVQLVLREDWTVGWRSLREGFNVVLGGERWCWCGVGVCGSAGCSMVGQSYTFTRSPGESVLLPCPCPSTGHVKPERVTWSYSKAGSSDRTPVSNDTGSYRGRVWTFDQTGSRNLSLLISDLTKEDAGDYTCTSDQHTSYVTLQVKGQWVNPFHVVSTDHTAPE